MKREQEEKTMVMDHLEEHVMVVDHSDEKGEAKAIKNSTKLLWSVTSAQTWTLSI